MTFEKLQAEMDEALQFAGVPEHLDAADPQPARHAVHRHQDAGRHQDPRAGSRPSSSGSGSRSKASCSAVPGTRSVYAERVTQGYFTDIQIERDAIARYGLTIEDVQDVIQTAIGGENITRTVEGRERYPVNVRYERDFRGDLPALERVLVPTPAGAQVPLGQLAHIVLTPGPAMIRDEDGQLAGYVYVDTADPRHRRLRRRGRRRRSRAGSRCRRATR